MPKEQKIKSLKTTFSPKDTYLLFLKEKHGSGLQTYAKKDFMVSNISYLLHVKLQILC